MKTWNERLTDRMKELGLREADLARACGVKPPSVHYWITGKTKKIEGENLLLAAKALRVDPEWLRTGKTPKHALGSNVAEDSARDIFPWKPGDLDPDQFVIIPRFKSWAGAGHGNEYDGDGMEPETQGLAFTAAFCRLVGWSKETHYTIRARGDSMIERGIRDGWTLVIDSRVNEIVPQRGDGENVYLIDYDGQRMLKHLAPLPGGGLMIASANSRDPIWRNPIHLSPEQAELVRVLGLVVHAQGLF